MNAIRIGAASRVINNEIGRPVQGASVDNVAQSIRDDCEANALFLTDDATSFLLISCDLCGLERRFVDAGYRIADTASRLLRDLWS